MSVADKILSFYQELNLSEAQLPKNVKAMNPYEDTPEEVGKVIREFYKKFYGDQKPRGLILGINPGRFGAGVTGIPFTDSYRLEDYCGIEFPTDTRETSSAFVYEVIDAYGDAKKFYQDWFIGAVSPLGFVRKNEKGNWINYNYYDDKELEKATRPFIVSQLKKQLRICGQPSSCIVLGTGKNHKFLQKLNKDEKLFEEVIPLEHPRYIMQYKQQTKRYYVEKFLKVLKSEK